MASEESKQFIFNWKIENYDLCFHKPLEFITSPEFTAESICGTRWYLKFYPKGSTEEYPAYTGIFLYRKNPDARAADVNIEFCVDVLGPDEKLLATNLCTSYTFKQSGGGGYGWSTFCKIEDITNEISKSQEKTLTFRCILKNKDINNEAASACDAKTNFEKEQCSFPWPIKLEDLSKGTKTTKFTFPNTSQFKITLSLSEDQITAEITKLNIISFSQLIYIKTTVLDTKNTKELKSVKEFHLFESSDVESTCKLLFGNKDQFENDLLNFKFEFTSSKSYSSVIEKYSYGKLLPSTLLQTDMSALYVDKKHSDIQLVVGDEILQAHKSILAARSPVFDTLLKDNSSDQVVILDSDPKTMTYFVKFLYTGQVDITMGYKDSLKLMTLADKYKVPSLKETCSSFLTTVFSFANVCEILYTADLFECELLKTSAIDYIVSNAKKILPSPEWGEWIRENFELGIEVFTKLSAKLGSVTTDRLLSA